MRLTFLFLFFFANYFFPVTVFTIPLNMNLWLGEYNTVAFAKYSRWILMRFFPSNFTFERFFFSFSFCFVSTLRDCANCLSTRGKGEILFFTLSIVLFNLNKLCFGRINVSLGSIN